MNILGIDFGTTKTLAARWDERSHTARLMRLGRSGDAIPTTIYADNCGRLEFGEDADDMRVLDGAGWKGRIKRDLGKSSSIVLNGNSYRVVDLVAGYLSYILRRSEEEVFHGTVDRAVITVPALYGPAERHELKQAAAQAGFKTFELLDEPVAAGLAFLHDKKGTDLGEAIMVFDWGGGTLDLALVESQDGEFKVNHRWIGGDKNLGGEDIDDSVIEGVDGLCSEEHGRVDEQEDQMRLHIQRNLKEGKELLSRRSEHTFRLRFKQPIEFKWSRKEFETFTASAVNRALDCLREQLRKMKDAGIKPKQVLLVGGSSSMPVIKRRIEDELGLKPILWEHSQTAVALGAATHALRFVSLSEFVHTGNTTRPPKVPKEYTKEIISSSKVSNSEETKIKKNLDEAARRAAATQHFFTHSPSAKRLNVTIDTTASVGTLLSGNATFSDGNTVWWFVDQSGRFGMRGPTPGYEPPPDDVPTYQAELDRLITEHLIKRIGQLKLSIGWNEVGVVVFAQLAGNENELEQIMNNSHMEIMPSLFVNNISNQPLNRIEVAGAYDGSTFTVSMPNYIPVLEAGEEIELDQITLGFIVEDGMLLKVTWFGQEDDGCTIEVNHAQLGTPLPHLPIAVFVKDGTFSGKILQIYNGSPKNIKNLLFTKSNGATYKLKELPPGGPCNIGWYEFSDSANLKIGDVVVITKSKHRSTIVHIH
jgi:actin-like ATPase involved in cell morphogenesis